MKKDKNDAIIKYKSIIKRRNFVKKILLSFTILLLGFNKKSSANEDIHEDIIGLQRNQKNSRNEPLGLYEKVLNFLSLPDGYKYIGECENLKKLHSIIPVTVGQVIKLRSWHSDLVGNEFSGGGKFYATKDNLTENDEGINVRVNSVWCWKRSYSGIVDATWFGVLGDGVAREENISSAIDYIVSNGGILLFPKGIVNFGILRKKVTWFENIKPFVLKGHGLSTCITFENIDPPLRKIKQNWVNEPYLLSFYGKSALQPINSLTIEDLCIDYSSQKNKGGTNLDTLSECHPTPHSKGTTCIYLNYCFNPIIKNVRFSNIYGNGLCCRFSFNPIAEHLTFINVSANQIISRDHRMDQDSDGGAVFFWSCFSGRIENCVAWNNRKYTVDFLSPDNKQQLKDTLCGYIAFWCEYGLKNKDLTTEIKPEIDWAHALQNNDIVSRGAEISNCIASGYVIGIKSETEVDVSIINNVIINCYLPITCSGVRGIVQRNYTNMLTCDDIKCPQGGLEQKRSHLGGMTYTKDRNYNLSLEISYNYSKVKNYPAFNTSRMNIKFLYNYIDFSGDAPIFHTDANERLFGLEVIGNTFYYNMQATPKNSVLFNHSMAIFEKNTFFVNCETIPSLFFKKSKDTQEVIFNKNTISGPLILKSETQIIINGNYFSNRKKIKGYFDLCGGKSLVKNNIFEFPESEVRSLLNISGAYNSVLSNQFILAQSEYRDVKYMGVIYLYNSCLFTNISNNIVMGDIHKLVFISAQDCEVLTLMSNISEGEATLLDSLSNCKAPLIIQNNSFKDIADDQNNSLEPNRTENFSKKYRPLYGDKINFIYPVVGDSEGIVMTRDGWCEFGHIKKM